MQPNKQPIVYGNEESGHTYKVCLYLSLMGQSYEYQHVNIFGSHANRGEEFLSIARFNEVPVIRLGDTVLSQSNAILLHLERVLEGDHMGLFARADTINQWLFWEMSRLAVGVANLRYAYRFEPETPTEITDLFYQRAVSALGTLENALSAQKFLLGQQWSIADISCCSYLYWLEHAQIDVGKYPSIAQWLDRIASCKGWEHPDKLISASRRSPRLAPV